ncbi:FAD-dependent monooxygenase [Cupriavidus pauculus]|uniref:FAD-dependent monooxygenase n=1 Tax=Cupriavidus pauculus TaxID=82633 RepID=UPI0038578994
MKTKAGSRGHSQTIVVIGTGPIGLVLAAELALQNIPVLLIDDGLTPPDCGLMDATYDSRVLDALDRVGCATDVLAKCSVPERVVVSLGEATVCTIEASSESGARLPAHIRLHPSALAKCLRRRIDSLPLISIRQLCQVTAVKQGANGVELALKTPFASERLFAQYVVDTGGSESRMRRLLNVDVDHARHDALLIADFRMSGSSRTQDRLWFDAPFHGGPWLALQRLPKNGWRLYAHLGGERIATREAAAAEAMRIAQTALDSSGGMWMESVEVRSYPGRRLEPIRQGRVFFTRPPHDVGFPIRQCASAMGFEDARSLAWKLAYVMQGAAPSVLLETFGEVQHAALCRSTRSTSRNTEILSPRTSQSHVFRNAMLTLASHHEFARSLFCEGQGVGPAVAPDSTLTTRDADSFSGQLAPGMLCPDAAVDGVSGQTWLRSHLGGEFVAIIFGAPAGLDPVTTRQLRRLQQGDIPFRIVFLTHAAITASASRWLAVQVLRDSKSDAAGRYDARAGTCYLIRPDTYICARWRDVDAFRIADALACAVGNSPPWWDCDPPSQPTRLRERGCTVHQEEIVANATRSTLQSACGNHI